MQEQEFGLQLQTVRACHVRDGGCSRSKASRKNPPTNMGGSYYYNFPVQRCWEPAEFLRQELDAALLRSIVF